MKIINNLEKGIILTFRFVPATCMILFHFIIFYRQSTTMPFLKNCIIYQLEVFDLFSYRMSWRRIIGYSCKLGCRHQCCCSVIYKTWMAWSVSSTTRDWSSSSVPLIHCEPPPLVLSRSVIRQVVWVLLLLDTLCSISLHLFVSFETLNMIFEGPPNNDTVYIVIVRIFSRIL